MAPTDWREPEPSDLSTIEIMVETNGVHTALVLPLVSPERDWRGVFPIGDVARPDRPYTHVSISWGERQVFLQCAPWVGEQDRLCYARAREAGTPTLRATQ